jgi:hypothetical protein
MKIKFYIGQNTQYTITDSTINGVDLSVIPPSTTINPMPDELTQAGILSVHTDDTGELFVTLQQSGHYDYPVMSHDWKEGEWINASDYDPAEMYIVPLSVQDKTDYYTEYRDATMEIPSGQTIDDSGYYVVQIRSEEDEIEVLV